MTRYICIDLGDKRTGIAVGDDATGLITPQPTIEVPISIADGSALLESLAREIERHVGPARPGLAPSHRRGALVFGLPLNMDGTENPRTRIVRAFAARLAERAALPAFFQDERLTTADADWQMARSGLTRQQKKDKRDALAAATILRDFLAARSGQSPSTTPYIDGD